MLIRDKAPVTLLSIPPEIIDTVDVAAQMKCLADSSFSRYYKVCKFHISPVEYKINLKDLILC
ncbi:MAG: hypothetical protein LBG45_12720 [Dysgonamonadaceae bacterium]|nr:hypothetical protein [Dysgonamonadaceae bacterium]